MVLTLRSAVLTLLLSVTGAAQAYTVLLTDDYNGGEYGSIWGKCNDGTDFEVRWTTEGDVITYAIGTSSGSDQYDLMRNFCASHGG